MSIGGNSCKTYGSIWDGYISLKEKRSFCFCKQCKTYSLCGVASDLNLHCWKWLTLNLLRKLLTAQKVGGFIFKYRPIFLIFGEPIVKQFGSKSDAKLRSIWSWSKLFENITKVAISRLRVKLVKHITFRQVANSIDLIQMSSRKPGSWSGFTM